MAQAYARFIHRFRFAIVVLWVLLVAGAMVGLPSLTTVVASQNANYLPANASVTVAQSLLNRVNPSHQSGSTAVIALYRAGGLDQADLRYFQAKLHELATHKKSVGITSVQDAFNSPHAVASSFTSASGTTSIALVGFSQADVSAPTKAAVARLHTAFATYPKGAHIYFTGDAPIQQDEISISQSGVQKTALVTVVLVLLILLLVFRSLLAPLLTLLAIGISFLISSGLVALLAEHGLPSSTFTQTFLIAVLFGAGTDYTIILQSRFREELTKSEDVVHALGQTLASVAKTMTFSASTVFVSFAVLFFTRFGLYRSAVGVSIGIAVVLVACLTFLPALMAIFGRSLFWPRRPVAGAVHQPSRLWGFTSGIATRKPWYTLLALCVALVPVALLFTDQRTFDPLSDIPDAPSATGFHVVASAFGPGHVLPMQLVLHTTENLRTPQGLATIAQISAAITHSSGVAQVLSATQPTGKVIQSFTIAHQNTEAAQGIRRINQGIGTLASSLTASGHKVAAGASQAQQLDAGAAALAKGLSQESLGASTFSAQMLHLNQGFDSWQRGVHSLSSGLQTLSQGATSTANGSRQLTVGLKQSTNGSTQVQEGLASVQASEQKLAQLAQGLASAMAAWAKAHPQDAQSPQWQQIMAMATAQSSGTAKISQATSSLAAGSTQLTGGLSKLTAASTQLSTGLTHLSAATQTAAAGARTLADSSGQLAQGTATLTGASQQLSSGTATLAAGGSQVASGVHTLTGQLGSLATGLQDAGSGTAKALHGNQQVQAYLSDTKAATTYGNPGFYVPARTIADNASLNQALQTYISPDGHIASFTVVLTSNPFSMTAIRLMPSLLQTARTALASSPLSSGTILAAGTTPTQAALNQISTQDFTHAVLLIMGSILILLILMLRSILTPLYILASLAGTYFITMGLLQTVVIDLMHKSGLSWTVPFFVFLLLVALGVDYCIFLMSRFEEELRRKEGITPAQAMRTAMGYMGNVIFSAAIIMAGTFGSMTVSGVTSLVEIGLSVIIGLFLYTTIILGFFVPAFSRIINRGHFWPFRPLSENTPSVTEQPATL